MSEDILNFVCFRWENTGHGFVLPSQTLLSYGADHVNKLYAMLSQNLTRPFRLICFTDNPHGLRREIVSMPLWDKCRYLGGCYNRLYVFSEDFRHFIGKRFVCIDIDCVITGNLDHFFDRKEDFVINAYQGERYGGPNGQLYNGSLVLMDAGCRAKVWTKFDRDSSPQKISNRADRIGTDQAWIREILGPDEARFGPDDGVYEARDIGETLPENAKIVFFSGRRDPSKTGWKWVQKHYR